MGAKHADGGAYSSDAVRVATVSGKMAALRVQALRLALSLALALASELVHADSNRAADAQLSADRMRAGTGPVAASRHTFLATPLEVRARTSRSCSSLS
jgi:hypothetical protein